MIKPKKIQWDGVAACKVRRGMHIGFCWESQKAAGNTQTYCENTVEIKLSLRETR
jgi:hypothetical protein